MRLALALIVLLSACTPTTLVAERIVLVDGAGEPQIYLGLDDTGERRGLVILDSKGTIRGGLNLVGDAAELLLTDGEGNERVRLWTAGDVSGWSLRDPATQARLSARVEGGQVQLRSLDRNGEETLKLPLR